MKVLVAGWIGSTNLGDELVFAGLRALLRPSGVQLSAISVDPGATRRDHGVGAVGHLDAPTLVRAIDEADAVVFGGGGLLQDDSSALNLPYHLSRLALARVRGTPYAVVGLGVGGLSTSSGRRLARLAMRPAVGLAVRDEDSRRLLETIGVPSATVAADLAFALPTPAVAVSPGDHLAVCLRPWSADRARRPAAAQRGTIAEEHLDALARALDEAASATGLGIEFVALQADRDDAVHARVAERMRTPSTRVTPSSGELVPTIAGARAVVAMRYHGGVAATLAGVPSVLIGYAPKVDALAHELGAGGKVLAWDPRDLADVPAALEAVLPHQRAVTRTRADLQARQAGNRVVLDRLLEAAARPR
ncbi:polysaccharide pyruvyl transferase family protein [Egicoccus halophilus]|uniref:Polysaccharide pyruvyl transferase CsaB n=1 Tax=Egicoccus halophilus TaxID=1670830 RepID=A0A8J3ETM8_9ACTN|nr:polysaccharide pyruvyl transferase family protein [Egicoccus halophilus]GGI05893.1 polysaccharide pyruvyl transferase CsaB [Egicoccus halophilus]